MEKLIQGIQDFHRDVYPKYQGTFRKLAHAQSPLALLITCADSRILPSMLVQGDPGDLFICRNAGNIVPAYNGRAGAVTATLEYAVDVLKVPDVIVCGHSDCGAMKGALQPEKVQKHAMVSKWLRYAHRARRAAAGKSFESEDARLAFAAQENVLGQLANLRTHPCVAEGLSAGRLQLHGWYLDLPTERVLSYSEERRAFVPVEEQWKEAFAARTRQAEAAA